MEKGGKMEKGWQDTESVWKEEEEESMREGSRELSIVEIVWKIVSTEDNMLEDEVEMIAYWVEVPKIDGIHKNG